MKAVMLAGGLQSTIDNIVEGIPKPMAEIGGKPILWHIMKNFSAGGGVRTFIFINRILQWICKIMQLRYIRT